MMVVKQDKFFSVLSRLCERKLFHTKAQRARRNEADVMKPPLATDTAPRRKLSSVSKLNGMPK
jgi:hypothetical protein